MTDTRRGQVIFFDQHLSIKSVLMMDACPPVESRVGLDEWLQNVLHLQHGLYAAIDIHRSCIWLFDPDTMRRRKIAISPDWAVQNVIAVNPQRVKTVRRRLDEFPQLRHNVTDPLGVMVPRQMRTSGRWRRR